MNRRTASYALLAAACVLMIATGWWAASLALLFAGAIVGSPISWIGPDEPLATRVRAALAAVLLVALFIALALGRFEIAVGAAIAGALLAPAAWLRGAYNGDRHTSTTTAGP
jgi:hypothetical protein